MFLFSTAIDPQRALIAAVAALLIGVGVFIARRIQERIGDKGVKK